MVESSERCDRTVRGELRAAIWLLWSIRGVRFRHVRQLEERFGAELEGFWTWEPRRLQRELEALDFGERVGERIVDVAESGVRPGRRMQRELERLPDGAALVHVRDDRYPGRLLELDDPPVFLAVDGSIGAGDAPHTIAVVGSRDARPRDVRLAKRIVGEVAAAGVVVVSGGALGIDRAAHEAALEVGGETVTLLPGGLDCPTPRSNIDVFRRIPDSGALVSEYPAGVEVRSYHFPRRNRLIAALGDATFVVRAGPDSGTMLTADASSELGRPICALPGRLDEPLAEGCLELIYEGAQLVRGARDIMETYFPQRLELQGSTQASGETADSTAASTPSGPDPPEAPVLPEGLSPDAEEVGELLTDAGEAGEGPTHVDVLSEELGWEAGRLQSALLELELHAVCEKVGGAQAYRLVVG